LKLKYDEPLSNFAFDFNVLRPYGMAQILQGKPNNYETDLIRPIIDKQGA